MTRRLSSPQKNGAGQNQKNGIRELRQPHAGRRRLDRSSLEFAAAIAHDMRGPLTTITTTAELLEQELKPEESTHLITVIQRQAQRLNVMVQDLAEYANLQNGSITLHPVVVDLTELVQTVCHEYHELQTAHQLLVELPAAPVRVRVDRDKARRMLENLLTNAFKYSPKGSTVLTRLRAPDNASPEAVIEVQDEGEGVPPHLRAAIFQPFFRLNGDRCAGQGLGLYIVQMLAKAHGGRVWVESGETGGSRFCFSLPVRGPGQTSA